MEILFEKLRQLNEVLKESATTPMSLENLTLKLSKILGSNTYIVENDGKILSYAMSQNYNCDLNYHALKNALFPKDFADKLLKYSDTVANEYERSPICTFGQKGPCIYKDRYLTIVPIMAMGDRIGTFILAKYGDKFSDNEIILFEYSAAIVVMELLRHINEEQRILKEKKSSTEMALHTLSYSELEAVKKIIDTLENDEGLVVASTIANEAKITRSVVSNALRKLESANIIQTRSLGMKGTHIKIINSELKKQLDSM